MGILLDRCEFSNRKVHVVILMQRARKLLLLKLQVMKPPIPLRLVGELIRRMERLVGELIRSQKDITMNVNILILQIVVARLVVFI